MMDYLKKMSAVGVMAVLLVAMQAYGFAEPTLPPPDGNVSAPLNTGGFPQGKLGSLVVNQHMNADSGIGFLLHKGVAQFGTGASSGPRVVVNGKIKIMDGSQGDKKVLVSDGGGLGTWKNFSDIGPGCPPSSNCTTLPDGTIIQWGIADFVDANPKIVTLPRAYNNTAYAISVSGQGESAQSENAVINARHTDARTITLNTDGKRISVSWMTIGR